MDIMVFADDLACWSKEVNVMKRRDVFCWVLVGGGSEDRCEKDSDYECL